MRGFPLAQLNVSLRREFRLWESLKLQFRAEMFNAVNHPPLAPPRPRLRPSIWVDIAEGGAEERLT
jgi:hypothetical protein